MPYWGSLMTAPTTITHGNPMAGWRRDLWPGAVLVLLLAAYYVTPWWLALPLTVGFVAACWWRLDLALLLAPITAPAFRAPRAFDAALFGRTTAFEVSLAEYCLLACAVAWALRWVRWPAGGEPPRLMLRSLAAPAAFVAAATLTLPFTLHLREALREYRVVVVEPAVFYVLAVSTWRGLGDVWRALYALTGLGIGISLFSLYHYWVIGVVENTGGVKRILAVYHSPNHLALFMGRLIPVVLAQVLFGWLVRRSRALTAVPAASLSLLLLVFYFTYSRGALIGIGAGALVLLVGWRPRVAALAGVAGLVLVLGLTLVERERMVQVVPLFQRVYVWRAALAMALDHPLMGVGLDNFLYYYPQYILPEARLEPDISHPHNLLLDFWLRTGVLGVVALAGVQVYFWRLVRGTLAQENPWMRWAALSLAASMVDFLVHGLIDNSYFLIDLAFMFWCTVALATVLARSTQPATVPATDRP